MFPLASDKAKQRAGFIRKADFAGRQIPIPSRHLRRFKRQTQPLLAVPPLLDRSVALGGGLGEAQRL